MAKTNKYIIPMFSDKETVSHEVKGKAATMKSNFLLLSICHLSQTSLLWKLITLQLLLKNTCDPWLIFSIQIHSSLKTQFRASLVAQRVKNLPTVRETWIRSLDWEDPLEEGMATHSSILAWKIPMDRGPWQATVHWVTMSQTWLSS